MNLTTTPPAAPASGSGGAVWLDRLLERRLLAALSRLEGGCLRIVDPAGGEWIAGGADAGLPPVTVTVRDRRFYRRLAFAGSLGAAAAYVAGEWETDNLTVLLRLFARNLAVGDALERGGAWPVRLAARLRHALRRNTRGGSRRNIRDHYDIGNAFFALFLDESMTYSCGIFEPPASTLEEAQREKLDRVCRRLALSPADHVLEIGCGWGSFAIHAASQYGCRVTATTVSREQHAVAVDRVRAAGLSDRVTILLRDYRDLNGTFDKLVSIEMIESVGRRFLPVFFARCSALLDRRGAALIQAIVMPEYRYEQYFQSADFIQTCVFPGGHLPSIGAMLEHVGIGTDLRLVNLEDITPHYVRTLQEWRRRFVARRDEVARLGYSEAFARLWLYYLAYCEAGFAERYIGTVQAVLAKPGSRINPSRETTSDRALAPA